ncbi:hypothetical protein PMIN03_001495 [Paraphaeosphaeria minitans]
MLGGKNSACTSTFLWGGWISSVPGRIGNNSALDDAADCFVPENVAYYNKKGINDASAIKMYNTAIARLQNSRCGQKHEVCNKSIGGGEFSSVVRGERAVTIRNITWQYH